MMKFIKWIFRCIFQIPCREASLFDEAGKKVADAIDAEVYARVKKYIEEKEALDNFITVLKCSISVARSALVSEKEMKYWLQQMVDHEVHVNE